MINEHMMDLGSRRSTIRELFEYGNSRAAIVGRENVFDFSIGNPNVPAPEAVRQAIYAEAAGDPVALHGYTSAQGAADVRGALADSLNKRFGTDYTGDSLYLTAGAAAALSCAFKAIVCEGDEIVVFAPYFPEYKMFIESGAGAKCVIVPPSIADFQIDFGALEQRLNEHTKAVVVNSPNNPSGAVYSEQTIKRLADMLRGKEKEYGHPIYLISDEPYREIVFDGGEQPYPSKFYDNTLSCYSYSKSLSLPGERIGYVAVNPRATDAKLIVPMCGQISRGTGHNCPSSTAQLAVAKVVDETSDLSVYETNMNLLYDALARLGFDVVRPGGTFYIFPKALEEDANAFCMKAKDYDLILVPSDSFGVPGYFRMAYCIDTEKVERSIAALEKFVHEVYGR